MTVDSDVTVQADGVIAVSGRLSYDTAADLLTRTTPALRDGSGPATIDLRAVERIDSAGLALLVEWLRLARLAQRPLSFVHLSEQLCEMIRVHGLGRTLGVNHA